jgi:hypothetical protein
MEGGQSLNSERATHSLENKRVNRLFIGVT